MMIVQTIPVTTKLQKASTPAYDKNSSVVIRKDDME